VPFGQLALEEEATTQAGYVPVSPAGHGIGVQFGYVPWSPDGHMEIVSEVHVGLADGVPVEPAGHVQFG
jgi:hypothetical protein